MSNLGALFWAVMIFGSIFWYGFLVFYIGYFAGREILQMTKRGNPIEKDKPPSSS